MRATLRRLSLRSFRNYEALELDLDEGFHVVSGPNAQGKTNLLEALYLLSSTRLLRGVRDAEAIRQGDSRSSVTGDTDQATLSMILEAGTRKRAFLNGVSLPRAADLIGRLPCVCVSTADLPIVRGEPADRRLFLDLELSQASAGYLRDLTHYKRALEQRNALLKLAQDRYVAEETYEPWELQIAQYGSAMRQQRLAYTRELEGKAREIHGFLGDGEPFALSMAPNDTGDSPESLLSLLRDRRGYDLQRKSTTSGPHRDEMLLTVEAREARLYGSQGQHRSALLALKLATLLLLKERLGETPLLLLDDILSDLDADRRRRLAEWVLENAHQAILTCTEPESAGAGILARAKVYQVSGGTIRPS